nr:MAG TPA: hypothetical protein [Caudoviricetes sp.]
MPCSRVWNWWTVTSWRRSTLLMDALRTLAHIRFVRRNCFLILFRVPLTFFRKKSQ